MRKLVIAAVVLAAACGSSDPARQSGGAAQTSDPRIGDLQTSMTELLERIDVLNDRVARLEQAGEQRPSQPAATRPAEAPVSSTTASAPSTSIGSNASQAVANARMAERYRNAIVLFGKNQLSEARNAFQQVFDADPNGELADNALFWIGETYYSAGKFSEAMRFYKRVADDYAQQNKAPDALYKLALTYEKSGDLVLARTTLEDIIKRYPYSASAGSAKAELKRIKY